MDAVSQFPLCFLPPVGYLSRYAMAVNAKIMLGERFEKQTLRSRFEIAGPNGRQLLSIPLIHKTTHASMAEVQVDYSHNWNVKHWRSIQTAYRKAPFFEFYAHYFESLFSRKYTLLAEMSLEAMAAALKILKLNIPPLVNTDFQATLQPIDYPALSSYNQVFIEKNGFLPGLSVLDLVFNEGPAASEGLVC